MKRLLHLLFAAGSLTGLALLLDWFRGIRSVPVLRDELERGRLERPPSLSVIVPACNEELSVRASVETLLAQDYTGDLEVIAVDDRSTDRTGEILEELRGKTPDLLRVPRVRTLPEGWLGKNHALHLGAAQSGGEWLLFTDADVRFTPPCVRYAMDYAARNRLRHLTLPPDIVSRSVLLGSFVATFALIFEMTQRPWRVSDPEAREAIGVGAFNLIRRDVYEEIGGHRGIAMRPDDDMKLALLVKKGGFSQSVAYGTGLVSVEWHRSLPGAVRGLGKSIFPSMDYRLDVAAVGAALLILTNVLPFAGLLFARGAARALSGLNVLAILVAYAYRERRLGSKALGAPITHAALHPFEVCVFVYAVFRSVFTILRDDGVEWRGTRYPLDALKRSSV